MTLSRFNRTLARAAPHGGHSVNHTCHVFAYIFYMLRQKKVSTPTVWFSCVNNFLVGRSISNINFDIDNCDTNQNANSVAKDLETAMNRLYM